jgi:glutathione S-transferase
MGQDNQKPLILYGSPFSTCTNAVKAFFRANNIEHEFKTVDIMKGEQKLPEFTKLNPLQKVPVLDDNGLILRESMAFSRYVANTRDVADNWYPKDAKKRVLVDIGLEYWSQNSSKFFAYAGQHFGNPTYTKEESAKVVHQAIEDFEKLFLKDNKFVAGGDKPSLADLPFIFYLLGQTLYTDFNHDSHKRLVQYFNDVYEAEPAIKAQADDYKKLFGK